MSCTVLLLHILHCEYSMYSITMLYWKCDYSFKTIYYLQSMKNSAIMTLWLIMMHFTL